VEYKAKGEMSSLHIIIFDEIDAICKTRGTVNNGSAQRSALVGFTHGADVEVWCSAE
jgi:vesicle-fusing ATPase